jgi:hypothetical protein
MTRGAIVGYTLAGLIASSLLRWTVIIVAILGCIFALIFRLARKENEI